MLRKNGGRAKRADGGQLYTEGPANYQPGFVQNAFGTGNLQHLQNPGMMATGDTLNRMNDYLQGKFAFDQAGRMAMPTQANPSIQAENAKRLGFAPMQQPQAPAAQQQPKYDTTMVDDFVPRNAAPSSGYSGNPQIAALYSQMLGRAPDEAGMKFWEDQLAHGMPISAIKNAIGSSSEALAPNDFYKGLTQVDPNTWYSGMLSRNRALNMGADNWNGLDLADIRQANAAARDAETQRRTDAATEDKAIAEAQAKRAAEEKAIADAQAAEQQRQLLLMMMMSQMWK